jgi:hypothetical protein
MPRETVYGFTALFARREILAVRKRHNELLDERGKTTYGSPEWDRCTDQINENIGRLDGIEAKYFGRK